MNLRVVKRIDIEDKIWNTCVRYAVNSMPYAYTWVLDAVCGDDWFGIVSGNYEMVLPITFKEKLGIKYWYAPPFLQQLGAFSKKRLENEELVAIFSFAAEKIKYAQIRVNSDNYFSAANFTLQPKRNYLLNLLDDYEYITPFYSQNTRRNIKKAHANGLLVRESNQVEHLVEQISQSVLVKTDLSEDSFRHAAHRLIYNALRYHSGLIYKVENAEGKELGAAFFLFDDNRIIYLMGYFSEEGKEQGAGFALVNHIIQFNDFRFKILDFEGSELAGVERFFKGFGAQQKDYFLLHYNHLFFPLNKLL